MIICGSAFLCACTYECKCTGGASRVTSRTSLSCSFLVFASGSSSDLELQSGQGLQRGSSCVSMGAAGMVQDAPDAWKHFAPWCLADEYSTFFSAAASSSPIQIYGALTGAMPTACDYCKEGRLARRRLRLLLLAPSVILFVAQP